MKPRLAWVAVFSIVYTGPALRGEDQPPAQPQRHVLFDFESPGDLNDWSALTPQVAAEQDPKGQSSDAKPQPAPKLELSGEHATSGGHALKLTFSAGPWSTITTTRVPGDWSAWLSFHADVTVAQPCLIGFRALQEKSQRVPGWDGGVSRWCKTQLLQPGTTHVAAPLHPNDWSAIKQDLGKVVRFEVFLYSPREGETVFLDNVALSTDKFAPPQADTRFSVLGTDLTVASVQELGKKLADQWKQPAKVTVAQAEEAFRLMYHQIKNDHPKAVLAVFRDGQKGYDAAHPDRPFAGWRDAYWSSHGPDGLTDDRTENNGRSATQEIFMRHRSPLMRIDLSSIPAGATIYAARLLVVRAGQFESDRNPNKPNMWVAEPCNRPWDEYAVNAYRYAKDRYWREVGGRYYGDDPDFLPTYIAFGPGSEPVNVWDFTLAVRFWTDGQHENHGFMLHGDSNDWFRAYYREAQDVMNRPALLVIYEPK
jgi:hypothetical protein